MKIEINVICKNCGEKLAADLSTHNTFVYLSPCNICADRFRENGYKSALIAARDVEPIC